MIKFCLAAALFFLIFFHTLAAQTVDWSTKPLLQRINPNLIENSSFDGSEGWQLDGAVYDDSVSRRRGSGSIRLHHALVNDDWSGVDWLRSRPIKVEPGKTYTFGVYVRSGEWPPALLYLHASYVTASNRWRRNPLDGGGRWSNAKVDGWEECVTFFTPEPGDEYIRLSLGLAHRTEGEDRDLWIDDVYFGEGRSFEQPVSPRKRFVGAMTRVDALGNVEIHRGGEWTPFFPLCIYADGVRDDFTVYSQQGFNTQMWASSAATLLKAKRAISDFNPDGMMSGMQIAQYLLHDGWAYGDIDDLKRKIEDIRTQGLMDYLLWYYWDNEQIYGDWLLPSEVTHAIREMDVDEQGGRMHPIYALQGNVGIARRYNNDYACLVDIVGTYVSSHNDAAVTAADRLIILDNIESQYQPVVVAQINYGVGQDMRPRLYAAIAHGARAMGFWRDFYRREGKPGVEELPWWPDFPNLRREIDALLPLIRQPHWTAWRVTCSEKSVEFGTRDMDGEGYVLVANFSDKDKRVGFTVSGLEYTPSEVVDYFSGGHVASFSNGHFFAGIPAHGSAVFRLHAPVSGVEEENKAEAMQSIEIEDERSSSVIKFTAPMNRRVTIRVYDVLGREVCTLADHLYPTQIPHLRWNGRDARGLPVANGMYFYRLTGKDFMQVKQASRIR